MAKEKGSRSHFVAECVINSFFMVAGFVVSTAVFAGPVGDLLAPGVFGLPWGASKEEVRRRFPGGRLRGWDDSSYVVVDTRPVLSLERRQSDLSFEFTRGELTGIVVEFPGGPSAFSKLKERASRAFGAYAVMEPPPVRMGREGAVRAGVYWAPDGGVALRLVCELDGMQPHCDLTISYLWPLHPGTLTELGLQ